MALSDHHPLGSPDDWRENYEQAAGYVLAEINRAGLHSPRAIYRLVEHLQLLTRFAARCEFYEGQRDGFVIPFIGGVPHTE